MTIEDLEEPFPRLEVRCAAIVRHYGKPSLAERLIGRLIILRESTALQ